MRRRTLIAAALILLAACGDTPLAGIGERSAEWINEPEVVTTTQPPVTTPEFVDVVSLQWSNDDIVNTNLNDPEQLVATIFSRRAGDRFIQASRDEIATALPGIEFPARVPFGSEWVSSQLVIENSGVISTDPSAAFGIWSAEPYTRSRSVGQMAVLTVSRDPDTAAEVAEIGEDVTCARFADRSTDICEILNLDGRQVWRLVGGGGLTLIWFDDVYRYELFGRSFVPGNILEEMVSDTLALSELEPLTS